MSNWEPEFKTQPPEFKVFDANLIQNAGTYDLLSAIGSDCYIHEVVVHALTNGAGFTSVEIKSNDPDYNNGENIMSAGEGAVGNIVAGRKVKAYISPFLLQVGKKFQYKLTGNGSGGSLRVCVRYTPAAKGGSVA